MPEKPSDLLRTIPSVAKILAHADAVSLSDEFGEGIVKLELRHCLDDLRASVLA